MSLKAKIEAVIYTSEEPVTLGQLAGLLEVEAQAELAAFDARQGLLLPLESANPDQDPADDEDALNAETLGNASEEAAEGAFSDSTSALRERFAGTSSNLHTTANAETPQGGLLASSDSLSSEPEPEPELAGEGEGTAPQPSSQDAGSASEKRAMRERERRLREYLRSLLDQLVADYAFGDRGLEIREVAGGYRLATKPEYHDAVRGFVRSLKPPLKLTLQALETLAVVAYKQPVTAPEVGEIRGVDSGGVLGSLLTRKLITTAGRKQVIGRPILYKTTKEFLLRFGLKDINELPSIEEFEKMAGELAEAVQEEMAMEEATQGARPDERLDAPSESDSPRNSGSFLDLGGALEERHEHEAQADGVPDEEHLTPPSDGPGEFTGDASVDPADNAAVDGRISGVPPVYDQPGDEATDSPAHDVAVQNAADGGKE